VFPLYWQHIRAEGGRTRALIPFLFYDYASRDKTKRDQVTPLGWRKRRGDSRSGMLLNYWWNQTPESRFRVFFPAYWQVRSLNDNWDVFGPFYRHTQPQSDPPSGHPEAMRGSMGMFPLVGGGWGDGVGSHYLFPLYYYARGPESKSFVTLPFSRLRVGDQRKGHVGLYFYSRDPDLRVDGIFPLWHRRASTDDFEKKTQVLNFYAARENEDSFQTLFPLYGYWSDPQSSKFLSWGLWRRKDLDVSAGWAWIYFWKNEDKDSTRVLFPLYWHFSRDPDWGLDLIFPIYTRYRDGDTTLTAIPPVIWKKTGDKTLWSFLFLYWRDKEPGRGSVTFAPFFHENHNQRRRMFFSPLLWTRTSKLSHEGIFPPVYWYKSAEARRTWVVPVFWRTKKPELTFTIVPPYYRWVTPSVTAQGLAPVWGRHRGDKKRGSYLMPFYWHSGDGQGNGLWIVPPLLMYVTKSDSGTDQSRFNMQYLLLGSVHKAAGSLEHDFFPLYRYVRNEAYANFWAPRIIALTAYENDKVRKSRRGYVFPFAWKRSPAVDWNLFVPLLYMSHSYDVSESTDPEVAPERGANSARTHVFFPLYWQGTRTEKRFEYIVPLYVRFADARKKIRALAPLYFSHDGVASGSKFRLLFPFYWRVASTPEKGASRDIRVYGLWYQVQTQSPDKDTRTHGLAPFFAHTRGGPGDDYFEILGGLFGRDVQKYERRFRFLYLFYTRPKPLK
jgi:hypothetical protein